MDAWTPSSATSTTSSGRTSTAMPDRPVSRSSSSFVCQRRTSSVSPLKHFPTIRKPPPAGSRAPRWRFESEPRRRPCPHSAPSTTRSYVRTGLTLRHALPRRPAAYGDVASFTTTPSWPASSDSSRTRRPSSASDVRTRGTVSPGATESSLAARSCNGESSRSSPSRWSRSKRNVTTPSGGASPSICATVSWKAAGPSAPIHSASPSSTACRTGRRSTASTMPGSACVISLRLRV